MKPVVSHESGYCEDPNQMTDEVSYKALEKKCYLSLTPSFKASN